jgi:hypothetical protein
MWEFGTEGGEEKRKLLWRTGASSCRLPWGAVESAASGCEGRAHGNTGPACVWLCHLPAMNPWALLTVFL